ncbi:MAG: septum formation initiator family protein [bacterium]|nr:septum formation initiator family protein [bacterium]
MKRGRESEKRVSRILRSRVILVFELAVIALFSIALVKEIVRRWEVRTEITRLENEIASLEDQNTELSGMIAYFQSDYYQEREARLKLGLQKEGESAVIVPGQTQPDQNTENTSIATTTGSSDQNMPPSKWWNYFFAKR